jgi:AcrR family transcriptional regulator
MNRSKTSQSAPEETRPTRKSRGIVSTDAPADDMLRPRKTPRQDRAAATVAAILEAAACILETEGFDGYTTNAVAERAGASIGSLYQYFPNKGALTRALIAREDSMVVRDLVPLLERPRGRDRLRELIHFAVAHQLRRPVLARLLDVEEARLPPSDEARRLSEMKESIFRHCLGDDIMALEPHIAHDLYSIIQGMVDAAGQRGETDAKVLARRVERAVLGYVDSFDKGRADA